MNQKDRPFYRAKYQNELMLEITGRAMWQVRAEMKRKGLTLKEYLQDYFKKIK